MKHVDFLRDLGGFHAGGKRVRYGVLYRSSDFSETSPKTRKRLEALFGESVVIDLRSPSEVAAEPEEKLLGEYIHNPPLGDRPDHIIVLPRFSQSIVPETAARFKRILKGLT